MILNDASERKHLLEHARTIAVVGASAKPDRPSFDVFRYLREAGYEAIPVTPASPEVQGVPAVPTLAAFAEAHGAPDIVDVFRKPEDVVGVVDEAIAVGARSIWFQLGIINQEAIERAEKAGLDVVVDRCIKVDHRDLLSR